MGETPPGIEIKEVNLFRNTNDLQNIMKELSRPENMNIKEMLKPELNRARQLVSKAESHVDQFLAMLLRVMRCFRRPRKEIQDVAVAFLLLLGEYQGYTEVHST